MGKFTDRPFVEFSDQTVKYRRNLLFSSCIAIALVLFELDISPDKPINFLGLPLLNVSIKDIKLFLLVIIGYQLIHFLWRSWDEWWAWRLQLTDDAASTTNTSSTYDDTTWIKSIRDIGKFTFYPDESKYEHRLEQLFKQQSKFFIQEFQKSNLPTPDYDDFYKKLVDTVYIASGLQQDLRRIDRFDNSIKGYSIQQRLRYHLLEIGVPVVLGTIAIIINFDVVTSLLSQ
ncbi:MULTISPECIES: hypothetical protein [Vibrio]|uniref:hypothetical protein n=1 Tax=Vibrio TaxID=662 RepID=UPI0013022691|nr:MULTISPECIES: hypothetical protein [Vibrio]WJG26987.1 hypothetical protein QSU96_04515 [Vibrio furnissii]